MKVRIFIYFFAATFLFGAEKASAQIVFTWNGGTSGSWNSAANWTVGGFPTLLYPGSLSPVITNDVAIVNTNNATISYTGNQTIGVLESTNYGVSGLTINFTGTTPVLTIASGLNMAQPSSFTSVIAFTGAGTAVIGGTSSFQYAGSMSIATATTVTFAASATLDFTANQGTLTNNGTLNFKSGSSIILGSGSALVSPGTVIGTSANFNISGTPAYISYGGKFVSTSCTFSVPSGGYLKSTSTSSAFTAYTSTFNLTGSGGAAYIYNNGTFRDHGSTYNLSGQGVYIQNVASSNMHFSGTTVNFSASAGNNNQNITNAGTFTADSTSAINLQSFTSYVTNSGTFTAGTSGSSCILNITGQAGTITNTTKGAFSLASTSIIYPNSYQATIINTSPGVFTLRSDALGTAAIGALTPTAECTGTFNAERFFQGSTTYDNVKKRWKARNYRIISPPLADTAATGLWGLNYIVGATAGQTTTANGASNAFITGCQGGSTTAGNPSTYLYRESYTPSNTTFTSGNFLGITNITNSTSVGFIAASDGSSHSLPVGNGVFFFFRGAATNWSTRTVSPYIAPENVTLTSIGTINAQPIIVKDWYSPGSSNLGFTGSGTGGNFAVRGFNMVGNPYPCTIDWNTSFSGTGITTVNVNPTIYEYDPVTNQYDTYITTSATTGTATGNGSRYIMSGQGFFVQANNTGASLMFTEAAKAPTQLLTGGTLLMGNPTEQVADSQLLRLNLFVDSLNHDDIAFTFNSSASPKYNFREDAAYIPGNNAPEGLSSFSDDSVRLAINSLPLPKLTPKVIRLSVDAAYTGTYTFQRTALNAIPQLYEIWLMDKLKKDSLDIRNNSTYTFDVDVVDTTTYGNNRFALVIRQNPALMVHLLNFTGSKVTDGSQIVWKTENEQNYTNFTVERSIDGGTTFNVLGGFPSGALGTYSFLDKNPSVGADMYRLKIEDLNGTITYSNIVTLMYANTANTLAGNIIVYPNPTGNVINLTINQASNINFVAGLSALQNFSNIPGLNNAAITNVSYGIKIINITGSVVKSASFSQANWQDDVGSFSPGTYIIQVINNKDNSIVGKSSFVKL